MLDKRKSIRPWLFCLVLLSGCAQKGERVCTNCSEPAHAKASSGERLTSTTTTQRKSEPQTIGASTLTRRFPVKGASTLAILAETVLRRDPDIRSAAKALAGNDTRVKAAWSGYLPHVNSSLTRDTDGTRSDLTLTQPLLDWGRTNARLGSAQANRNAAQAVLRQRQEQVVLNAITDYLEVLQGQRNVEIAEQNVAALKRIATLAAERLSAGASDATERDLVQLRLSDAQATLQQQKVSLEQARVAYMSRVGSDPGKVAPVAVDISLFDNVDLKSLIPTAPNVVSKKQEADSKSKLARADKLALLPGVNATARVRSSNGFEDTRTTIGVELRGPVNFGLASVYDAEAAQVEAEASKLSAEAEGENLLRKVERQVRILPLYAKQSSLIDGRIANALALRRLYEEQFVSAERSISDLLSAQANVYDLATRKQEQIREALLNQYTTLADLGFLVQALGVDAGAKSVRRNKP